MPIPVIISNFGIPVRAVDRGAPEMQVSSNGLGLPIRLSDNGVPFVVLGLEPVGQPPHLTSAPTVAPSSGPVGTVFTITPGSYSSDFPITRVGQLRQNGAVVANRTGAGAFTFTSTAFGPLVWTETVSNEIGSAPAASASAMILKQLQQFYDSGTIGIHLRRDGVTPTGGPATAIANEGGAGAAFNATVVGNPLPVNGNFLQASLTTGYPLTANPADIVGVRLMWVAQPASATGTYRYFGQNEAVNTNIRINNGTTLNLISNRTGSNVTVVIGGIPSSPAARLFEIEMTTTEARLWVNGALIGSATHPWSAFNIRSLTQGNSPTTQLFEGQLGDVLGVVTGRADTTQAIAAARYYLDQRFALGAGFPAPVVPTPPTSVVVIGASHEEAMFGRNLSTPNADATSQLAALGHNIPVYGWATGGARLTAARSHYEAARAAYPNALIVSQFGGNNVSDSRPYPGGTSAFNAGLADLLVPSAGDTRYYPASMTFRDYNDTTFMTPANGSKPYNENLLIPWIAQNFPHAIGAGGRPKVDLYRRVLADFENMLDTDNIHFTPAGYAALKSFYIARIADILSGVTPALITERVYDGPPPPVQSVNLTTAGGTASYAAGQFGQAMNSNGTFFARADRSLTPLTPAWGVEAWVRIPTVSRSNIFWGESGSAVYGLVRASGSSPAGVACISYAGANGSTVHLAGGPRIDNNAWHHVAVQFRSNGADLFVDGALVQSSAIAISDARLRDGAGTSNDSRFTVGHYASATQFIWSGQVDEVRIWEGLVLTATFTPRTSAYGTPPAGTVAYWALDGNLNGVSA